MAAAITEALVGSGSVSTTGEPCRRRPNLTVAASANIEGTSKPAAICGAPVLRKWTPGLGSQEALKASCLLGMHASCVFWALETVRNRHYAVVMMLSARPEDARDELCSPGRQPPSRWIFRKCLLHFHWGGTMPNYVINKGLETEEVIVAARGIEGQHSMVVLRRG